ncbi:hypothetical protein [Metallibacterium sp.]
MHTTIEKLMHGDVSIVSYFVAAKERWTKILKDAHGATVQTLAKRLTDEQMWFEHHCGGRWDGQEVMAWTAFASLYTTQAGFGDNADAARKLARAFDASMCSIEVKGLAKRAAKSYGVDA